jgi:hypothetical protein
LTGSAPSGGTDAVIETRHWTLKFELRRIEHFATRAAAHARVRAWIGD